MVEHDQDELVADTRKEDADPYYGLSIVSLSSNGAGTIRRLSCFPLYFERLKEVEAKGQKI